VAAGGDTDGSGGDESSLVGASDDLSASVLADGPGRAGPHPLSQGGARQQECLGEGEEEVEDEEEAVIINAASVPPEGPVVADKALLRMPSLDILGDNAAMGDQGDQQGGAAPMRAKKRWEA
jgi:hypothetical protein